MLTALPILVSLAILPPDPTLPFARNELAACPNAHVDSRQGTNDLTPIPRPISPDSLLEGRGRQMVQSVLAAKVKAAAHRDVPASREAFDARRAVQKKELMRALGIDPLPERTPLNARITGRFKRDGYHVERLVFDSRPNFPVTALVYVPDGPPGTKFPVIVNPHGHWAHKKAEPVVQSRAIFQALHGYLAVVVDSPGHSFEGNTPIERRWAGTHDDFALTLGAGCATGVYVWDLMRAVDYLETRPDADTSRIGITGASGGGLATVYAFAADDRFTAAVPVCYPTSLEINPNNGCLCNHVPGTLQIGDRADVLAIRAPAPVMIIGATNDAEFPPEGTRLTAEKLKALYSVFNAADNTSSLLVNSGHDYNQPMREAAVGFFDKHLRSIGDGSPVPEPKLAPELAESRDLLCLPDPPADLRTMRDLARERLAHASPRSFDQVVALNGGLPKPCPLNPRILDETTPDPHRKFILFDSEAGLTVPGILLLPKGELRAAVILDSDAGKTAAPRDFSTDALLGAGIVCFCIDARGVGELAGIDERLMAYLGTSIPFATGWDVSRAVLALRELAPRLSLPHDIPIGVAGRGPSASQAAMFAALMQPDAVAFVAGFDALRSYDECFDAGVPASAIQFRAADSAPLEYLRSLIRQPATWRFRAEEKPDPAALIIALVNH